MLLFICAPSVHSTDYYLKPGGLNPAILSNWADGTGAAPPSFDNTKDNFHIPQGVTAIMTSNWKIAVAASAGGGITININGVLEVGNDTISLGTKGGNPVSINVNSTGILSFGSGGYISSEIGNKSNIFKLLSGALIKIGSPLGLDGNITTNSDALSRTFDSGANYEFNGITPQTIAVLPATVGNLTINNKTGVTLNSGALQTASVVTIQPGAKLTLAAGNSITAANFIVKSDNTNGTGTFINNGTLSTTKVNVDQHLAGGRNWYISSPVTAASGTIITEKGNNAFYQYNETNNSWQTATTFTPGMGYIASIGAANGQVYSFTGSGFNASPVTINPKRSAGALKEGFNLAGNPYTVYLDWDAAAASATNMEKTIWYRTKSSDSYIFATYNANGAISVNGGTRYIPPMQAFWVRVSAGYTGGTVTFSHAMCSHDSSGTNRLKAPRTESRKLLRLQLSDGINTDETVVYFDDNASDGYDAYDSQKMANGAPVPDIYTLAGKEMLTINGLKNLTPTLEIPIGFTKGTGSMYRISATDIEGFEPGTQIELMDYARNTQHDLTQGESYEFSSNTNSSTTRLSLVLRTPSLTTGMQSADTHITAYGNEAGQVVVSANGRIAQDALVTVYNLAGQKLEEITFTGNRAISRNSFEASLYVVSTCSNGKTITHKVVIK